MSKAIFVAITLAMLAFLSGACGQKADSYESNNEIGDGSEINLSQTASANIFPAQDVDFYKIYIDNPGVLQAQLSNVPKEMKGRIDLYAKNMNWMGIRKDAEKPGDDVTLKVDIANAGWYYFAVSDLNGGSYGSMYSFAVSFEPVVDEEPNNEIGDATEIVPGQSAKGYIFPGQDVDFYKIFLNSSGVLQASLMNVPKSIASSMKGRIDLYGKNMNWLGIRKDAENPGDDVTLKVDIGNPGWYYLGISDLNGGSYNQTYEFQADFKPVVDQPNNEIGIATEIQSGQEIKGFIFPAGDVDFYKIHIDNPGSINASLESVPKTVKASMKGRIDLYGKNMNWMGLRKDAEKPGDDVTLKVDIANAGWYYFAVSDLNGGSYDVEYTFKVT